MEILIAESGPISTKHYLCYDEESNSGFLIDVPPDSLGIIKQWINDNGIKVEGILLTHTHWDHTADTKKVKDLTNSPVYVHPEDEYRLENPMDHVYFPIPLELESLKADKYLKNKEILKAGNIELEVRYTPGHTEGGVSFVNHKNKVIFAGDTLFKEGIGRFDLPGGASEKLVVSIQNELFALPGEYRVLSGHGPETTIAWEKDNNPYLLNGLL